MIKECFLSILIKKISFLCANVLNRTLLSSPRVFRCESRREEDFEMLLADLIEMKFDKLEALETMMENILRRISIIVAFVCAVLWQAARSRLSSSHNFSSIIESHINY